MKPLTVTFYPNYQGDWYWRIKSGNNKIVAIAGEGYKRIGGAFNSFRRLQIGCPFVVYQMDQHGNKAELLWK